MCGLDAIYMHIHTNLHACTHITHIHIYLHAYTHLHTHPYILAHAHTFIHICAHTHRVVFIFIQRKRYSSLPTLFLSFSMYKLLHPTVILSNCDSPFLYLCSFFYFYLYLYFLLSLSQWVIESDTLIDCSFVRSLILSLPRPRCWRRLRVKWSGVIQNPVCNWRFRLHHRAIRMKISSEWINVSCESVKSNTLR